MKKLICIILVLLLCATACGEHEYIEAITNYNGVYVMNAWQEGKGRMMLTFILNPNGTADICITQIKNGYNDSASIYPGTWSGDKVDCTVMWATILGAWQDKYGQMWIDVETEGLTGYLGKYSCMMVAEQTAQ